MRVKDSCKDILLVEEFCCKQPVAADSIHNGELKSFTFGTLGLNGLQCKQYFVDAYKVIHQLIISLGIEFRSF